MSGSEEYRRLVEEAGLPPEALPSDAFFTANVDSELARAKAEQRAAASAGVPEGIEAALAESADRAEARKEAARIIGELCAEGSWSGLLSTLAGVPAGLMDSNQLQEHIAGIRSEGCVDPLPIGVLISGSGTNLQALIDRIADGSLNAEIKLVVASRPSAKGLARAEAAGIQTLTLSKEIYADPIQADEIIASELYRAGVAYVIMAGYMRKVHAPLLATFPDRIVNLHPALLPSFPGAHAIDDAFRRGVKVTGVTVHFANAAYDAGPIIAQRALPVEEGWDVEVLEAHIHEIEHELYPHVVQLLADGRVQVREDRTVAIS